MKLNIDIDSESFEKTIKEGMEALSKEELGEIIKQVILQAFMRCSIFSDMLVKTERNWNTETTKLGPLAEAAIKSVDMDEALAPFKKKMVDGLMENHQRLVEDMMLRLLIDNITNDDKFKGSIEYAVRVALAEIESTR